MLIYRIRNIINNKSYIGKTIKPIRQRLLKHLANARKKVNRYLYDAINKYGIDSFVVSIIDRADTDQELNVKEIFNILKFDTYFPNGYNMTIGGDGGKTKSDEWYKEMGLSKRGKPIHTEKFKKYLRERFSPNKGIKLDNKRKLEISNIQKELHKTKPYLFKNPPIKFGKEQNRYKDIDTNKLKELVDKKCSIKSIAKILSVSEPTIIYRFKDTFGLLISEYRRNLKCQKKEN